MAMANTGNQAIIIKLNMCVQLRTIQNCEFVLIWHASREGCSLVSCRFYVKQLQWSNLSFSQVRTELLNFICRLLHVFFTFCAVVLTYD